jgi:hypothetical protein
LSDMAACLPLSPNHVVTAFSPMPLVSPARICRMSGGAGLRPCRRPSGRREDRTIGLLRDRFAVESAERKLGGRAEALPHMRYCKKRVALAFSPYGRTKLDGPAEARSGPHATASSTERFSNTTRISNYDGGRDGAR